MKSGNGTRRRANAVRADAVPDTGVGGGTGVKAGAARLSRARPNRAFTPSSTSPMPSATAPCAIASGLSARRP